ncbi:hypothetical protein E5161_07450 [Cohnella pontilimi]|uniref:Uncharacterized protein n=1 Tax=Cohnella pontilimi TaxID=2564100 RepID=A0A4U0FD54_9BACL|nr:DUF4238 domain-containing protein [Cohnella pontilimi]TJY42677.1 hypothetical protein E5161_07450 [Cohnella pontilimi]
MAVSSEEQYKSILGKLLREGEEFPDNVTYEQLRSFTEEERYTVSFDNNMQMIDMLHAMDVVLQPLAARNWTVTYSLSTLGDFVCSDDPVSLHWLTNKESGIFNSPGHGLRDTEVSVPLSSRVMLLGQFEAFMPRKFELSRRLDLAWLNTCTTRGTRFIYSSKENFVWYSREKRISDVADFKRLITEDRKHAKAK